MSGKRSDYSNYGTRRTAECPKCSKLVAVSNTERLMRHKCIDAVQMPRLLQALETGGCVRFTWATCTPEILTASGETELVDGRTYQGFMNRADHLGLVRTETGSPETKDLIIEWRKI